MNAQGDGPEAEMVNTGGPLDSDGHASGDPGGTAATLTPERLAELRCWIARGEYTDRQTDRLIAKRIVEQGDL